MVYFQVLNHLEESKNGIDFPVLEKTLAQTKRVLRKNGLLLIITALPTIMRESIWFSQIHPDINDKLCKSYPSTKQNMDLFKKHRFQCISAVNLIPTTTCFFNNMCLNPEGPLSKEWRDGVSMLQIAGPEKEKEMIQMVVDMKEKDTLVQFVDDHDRSSEIGIMTLYACISL